MKFSYVTFFLAFSFLSCGTYKKAYYDSEDLNWKVQDVSIEDSLIYTLFLIGDAGGFDLDNDQNSVLLNLENDIADYPENAGIVFLGDNIYPSGMPEEGGGYRMKAEKILNAQIELSENFEGDIYFIPGNHDWNDAQVGGLESVRRQQEFIERHKGVYFYPSNGCGDPISLAISDDLTLLFLDSQWWLQNWNEEEGINENCDIGTRNQLKYRLEELFVQNRDKEMVVLLHHPIRSNGRHGGHYSMIHHFFPFYEHNNWIPLPVVGSLIVGYNKIFVSSQHVNNAHNKNLMTFIDSLAHKSNSKVTFASGHEHGLQFFSDQNVNYIVSGGGCKSAYISKGNGARYARESKGYSRLDFYKDGSTLVEYFVVSKDGKKAILDYRTKF